MSKPVIILLTLLFLTVLKSAGQSPSHDSQVVSKTISKSVSLQPNDAFHVIGEKAHVVVKGWNKSYVELKITFSADHADRALATRELAYMHYSLSREGSVVELRNAFIFPPKIDKIQSKLMVKIEVMMPSANALTIRDKYGNVEMNNLSGNVLAELQFSDLIIDNVSGNIALQSSFSEIRAPHLSAATFNSKDEESKYIMTVDKGSYSFNSKHGDLNLSVANIQSLVVDATHTDITIRTADYASYNYQLLSKEGRIYTPQQFSDQVKTENKQSKLVLTQNPPKPLLNIKTTFNAITIQ